MYVKDFADEFGRYRALGEKAMAQISSEALNRVLVRDGNSIAIIVRHIGGNLISRYTDFLTADGEKPWRNRDGEFVDGPFDRAAVDEVWKSGWDTMERELGALTDDDLQRTVTIRGVALTVHEALCRSLAHTAMHVGQIILLARIDAGDQWATLSIAKGQSAQYNTQPTLEKRPAR
jgi:hypothetical protein